MKASSEIPQVFQRDYPLCVRAAQARRYKSCEFGSGNLVMRESALGGIAMSSSHPTPQVTPERIFELVNAYQNSSALKAAVELDIFTAIGEGNRESASIAKRCTASERGVRILCDYLAVAGLLTKQNGVYGLAPDAAMFLDSRSPGAMGSIVNFLLTPALLDGFRDLTAVVRKGTTQMGSKGEGTLETENPAWVEFARSMAPMMAMPAELIAGIVKASEGKKWKVLDIAAGHGLFGIALARHNPNAEIVAADWPNVLEVAKENAAKAGVANRYRALPGDAFKVDFGTGYDIVLLTNFLHHFDIPTCESFLKKVHAALAPGGRAVTLEFVPNDDRVSPPMAAKFSMIMLASTPSGDAYTFAQYQKMFTNAGFRSSTQHELPSPEKVIVSEK
jgi:2-polyprenyl-3-methyl-5-hydroxy-6-metoxy-1,4-benzoquinol methylase